MHSTDHSAAKDLSRSPGTLLAMLRDAAPLVQCITNYVAMNVAANALLATGASPAMVHAPEEAAEFAGLAGALTVNIGTLSSDWVLGMRLAAEAARASGIPWVLDPVAHPATRFRGDTTAILMDLGPTIVRANASEIIALAGGDSTGRGADSTDPVDRAEEAAQSLARGGGTVIAVTGSSDYVTDGSRAVRIHGGHPVMPRVTALGCALTCLIGGFSAVEPDDPLAATVAALACFAVAGGEAGAAADGPGSFAWRFLDALAALDPETLDGQLRMEPI